MKPCETPLRKGRVHVSCEMYSPSGQGAQKSCSYSNFALMLYILTPRAVAILYIKWNFDRGSWWASFFLYSTYYIVQ
jgi:hypothetical protein